MLMTGARIKALECIPYINYLIQFKRDMTQVQTLIDSESEINSIYPTFTKELSLFIRLLDVRAQKIDGTMLDTYEIVIAALSVVDKANHAKFFKKTFLVANVSLEVVFEMFFLTLSGADVDFLDREFWWRTYIAKKAFPTTRCVKLVGKKKFAAAALDLEHEIFVVHIVSFFITPLSVTSLNSTPLNTDFHPSRRP